MYDPRIYLYLCLRKYFLSEKRVDGGIFIHMHDILSHIFLLLAIIIEIDSLIQYQSINGIRGKGKEVRTDSRNIFDNSFWEIIQNIFKAISAKIFLWVTI